MYHSKIEVNNKILKSELMLLNKAMAKKALYLPILETVKITVEQEFIYFEVINTQDNTFTVFTAIRHNNKSIESSASILICLKSFYSLVRTFNKKSFSTIAINDNQLIIESDNLKFTFDSFADVSEFLTFDYDSRFLTFERFLFDAEQFKTALNNCLYAVAKDDIRYYLKAAKFEIKAGNLTVISSDGHRLAMNTETLVISDDMQDISFVLPRESLIILTDIINRSNDIHVSVTLTRDFVEFAIDDYTIKSALIDCKYPDFRRVLETQTENSFTTDKKYFLTVLKTLEKTCNSEFKGLMLETENNKLFIDTGTAKSKIDASVQGNFKIGVKACYLIDMIKNNIDDNIKIDIPENLSVLKCEQGKNVNVLMPMRL